MADAAIVRFLVQLGKLVGGRMTETDAAERIALYLPVLRAQAFDPRVYGQECLNHVAAECLAFPGVGVLCKLLREWRRRHIPLQMLPAPEPFTSCPPKGPLLSKEESLAMMLKVRQALAAAAPAASVPKSLPLATLDEEALLRSYDRAAERGDQLAATAAAARRRARIDEDGLERSQDASTRTNLEFEDAECDEADSG